MPICQPWPMICTKGSDEESTFLGYFIRKFVSYLHINRKTYVHSLQP